MKHVDGEKNYVAPSLKTAPVFGGITGIIAQDVPDSAKGAEYIPSLADQSDQNKEHGEQKDMYRTILAASWVAQPGVSDVHSPPIFSIY